MAQPIETPYKSPQRKLVRFFEKSRDQWKTKCQTAKATVKRLENRVRFLEHSKAQWKSRTQTLEQEVSQLRRQVACLKGEVAALTEKKTSFPSPSDLPVQRR
jgi:chromosome segregation ATPase